jgi:ribonuclease-3
MVGHYLFSLPSDDELEDFEKKINYRFIDRALLREALQASAAWNEDGNKTLALIGDRVLDLVIVISGRKKNKPRGKCLALASFIS